MRCPGACAEVAAKDKTVVIEGGEKTDHLKPGIEAISLKSLQGARLAGEQEEWLRMGLAGERMDVNR